MEQQSPSGWVDPAERVHDPVAERRGTDLALGRLVDDEVAVAARTVGPVQKLALDLEQVRFEVELERGDVRAGALVPPGETERLVEILERRQARPDALRDFSPASSPPFNDRVQNPGFRTQNLRGSLAQRNPMLKSRLPGNS